MKEAYVSYEIAKLLKEKGFAEPLVNYYYTIKGERVSYLIPEEQYLCPTHQMTMAWLREKYKLHITVDCIDVTEHGYVFTSKIVKMEYVRETKVEDYFYSFEEAVEAAIKYTLENLI